MKILLPIFIVFVAMLPHPLHSALIINEFCSNNDTVIQDYTGAYSDWIELKNTSDTEIYLRSYCLSDNPNNLHKFHFPSGSYIQPGEIVLIWAVNNVTPIIDPNGDYYGTNFAISADGEPIVLSLYATDEIVDQSPAVHLDNDISYGRIGTGLDWYYFTQPTPRAENTTNGYTNLLADPIASVESGWYPDSLAVNFTTTQPGVQIRYTTDGTIPDENSPLWPGLTFLHNRTSEPNNYCLIPTVLPDLTPPVGELDWWFPPATDVPKIHTLKVRCIEPGALNSATMTKVYMVGTQLYDFPIVSLSMDPDDLFDPDTGIYVPGNGYDGSNPFSANFYQNWERPVVTDWFDNLGNHLFQKECLTEIHGTYSARAGQKSLRLEPIVSNDLFLFDYPFFGPDYVQRFYTLILRNSGNDVHYTMFRDSFVQTVFNEQNLSCMNCKPYMVFLEGEFWGIHNLREHPEEHYISNHFDIPLDSLDVVERDGYTVWGSDDDFEDFRDYLETHDETDPVVWQYINSKVDLENFTEYTTAEIFAANSDWPGNNIRFWRKTVPFTPNAPYGQDGRYRWMVFDMDWSFGLHQSPYWGHDTLGRAMDPELTWRTLLLRSFLHNDDFKINFINTLADRLNTNWVPAHITNLVDQFEDSYESSMPSQIERWRLPETMTDWQSKVDVLRIFAQNRPDYLRDLIVTHFDLPGRSYINLEIQPPGAAVIRINDRVDLNSGNYVYFQGIPISLQAYPEPGWEILSFNGQTADSLYLFPQANQTILLMLRALVPANVSLQCVNDSLILSWDAIPQADSYNVETNFSPYTDDWALEQSTMENSVILDSSASSKFYRVRAVFID